MNFKSFMKRQTMIIVATVMMLTVATLGVSYAVFMQIDKNTENQIVESGSLVINFTNGDSITGENNELLPISETEGRKTDGYDFTISNNGTLDSDYKVMIHNDMGKDVTDAQIAEYLNHENLYICFDCDEEGNGTAMLLTDDDIEKESSTDTDTGREYTNYILKRGTIKVDEAIEHNVKIWVREDADTSIIGKKVNLILEVEAVVHEEEDIIVDLDDNMIPIMYDETKSTWVKADRNNQNPVYKWYDYDNQQWANAVVVKETGTKTREYYNKTKVGTEIKEEDILAYYVYIPRYKYELFNANNGSAGVQEIKVEFETKDTKQSCGGHPESGNGCDQKDRVYSTGTNGKMLTHPAFTFGDKELNGIWVGKFETTGTLTANGITIKPSPATAITNKPLGEMFNTSRAIQTTTNNVYGFNSDSTKADSHMMKNMEWGAVAYLSHSKYGKYGNQIYTGATGLEKEVWINNSSSLFTGCAGTGVSATAVTGCSNAYTTTNGQKASTTGNINGIYDMSGGSLEYVMGNMVESTSTPLGTLNVRQAGTFSPIPTLKYYNSYTFDTVATSQERGLLGDATKETLTTFGNTVGAWYSDLAGFPGSTSPWFMRGGASLHEANTGVFAFSRDTGGPISYYSFRLVYSIL